MNLLLAEIYLLSPNLYSRIVLLAVSSAVRKQHHISDKTFLNRITYKTRWVDQTVMPRDVVFREPSPSESSSNNRSEFGYSVFKVIFLEQNYHTYWGYMWELLSFPCCPVNSKIYMNVVQSSTIWPHQQHPKFWEPRGGSFFFLRFFLMWSI